MWVWGLLEEYHGSFYEYLAPQQIDTSTNWLSLSSSDNFIMGLKSDSTLWGWGSNEMGQLGDSTASASMLPIQIGIGNNWKKLSVGYNNSLGIKGDGTLWAWGLGLLGDGINTNSYVPIQIGKSNNWHSFSIGYDYNIAIQNDGTLWAWGYNDFSQLGDGTNLLKTTPVFLGACFNTYIQAFFDENTNNQKDISEPLFNHGNIQTIGTSNLINSNNTNNTNFNFLTSSDTGTYSISLTPHSPYFNVSPISQIVTFNNSNQSDTLYFAVQPIPNQNDLRISLIPVNVARPGFFTSYRVVAENVGTTTLSGNIVLKKEPNLTPIFANPTWDTLQNDSISWNFSNFAPQTSIILNVDFQVAAPPLVNNGDTLHSTAFINPLANDQTPNDNLSQLNQTVFGSFDPNDKTMTRGQVLTQSEYTAMPKLDYLIRFQNTGTDTAFTIIVRDTLDSRFNLNSLEHVSASHAFDFYVENGNVGVWRFNNILLPDSNINEPLSHGYIYFQIKTTNQLTLGDSIENSAAIYFDYNTPIITNNTVVKIDANITLIENSYFNGAMVYPNPSNGVFLPTNISFANLCLVNRMGQQVYANNLKSGENRLDTSHLPNDIYLLHLKSEGNSWTTKIIVKN